MMVNEKSSVNSPGLVTELTKPFQIKYDYFLLISDDSLFLINYLEEDRINWYIFRLNVYPLHTIAKYSLFMVFRMSHNRTGDS